MQKVDVINEYSENNKMIPLPNDLGNLYNIN